MFHDNDRKRIVNLDYQLGEKELVFLTTKTFFIGCYIIKFELSLDNLQLNIMHYIIALTIIIIIIIICMFIQGKYLINTRKYCYQQGPCNKQTIHFPKVT